jgi:uncharacterized repeat protein (TIGR04138 family)
MPERLEIIGAISKCPPGCRKALSIWKKTKESVWDMRGASKFPRDIQPKATRYKSHPTWFFVLIARIMSENRFGQKRKNSFLMSGGCGNILPMDQMFLKTIRAITLRDQRYRTEAYEFLMQALTYTQKRFLRRRHVSGHELVTGVLEWGVRTFGPLAPRVFSEWGIHTTEDLGHIVFNLVDHGILSKQEEDTFDSFRGGELAALFQEKYLRQLEKAVKRLR